MSERFLITGGAGFVGSNVAVALRSRFPRASVVCLDNLRRRGSEINVLRLQKSGIEFAHGDVRCPGDLEAVGGFDVLVECSADPSVLAGLDGGPSYVLETNLLGTLHCLEAARRNRAAVIFLSTSRVYPIERLNSLAFREDETRFALLDGQSLRGVSHLGVSEEFPLDGARSLYGATKLCSELIITEYVSAYGLRAVIDRCGVIAGPWQFGRVDQGVVALWVARHLFGGQLAYIGFGGRGKQVRDVMHVQDLVDLLMLQIDCLDELSGKTFNVGGGVTNSFSLAELTTMCQEVTGRSIDVGSVPDTRTADVRIFVTDCRGVLRTTGWKPGRTLTETVNDVAQWMLTHEEAVRPLLG